MEKLKLYTVKNIATNEETNVISTSDKKAVGLAAKQLKVYGKDNEYMIRKKEAIENPPK